MIKMWMMMIQMAALACNLIGVGNTSRFKRANLAKSTTKTTELSNLNKENVNHNLTNGIVIMATSKLQWGDICQQEENDVATSQMKEHAPLSTEGDRK